MHGIKGSIPFLSMNSSEPEYFKTTFFSQMAHFTFQQKKLPSPEEWKSIGRAAIATGNFPIAFKPQLLSPKDLLYPYGNSEDEPKQCFIDGGLFNNEPLGEAISLARKADEHDPEPDRLFILIDPNMNEWRIKSDISPDDGLHKHIKRMGEMIFGESTARDWLRAHEKNTEIEWRDQLVQALGHLMKSDSFVPEQQFADEFKGIAEAIVTQKHVLESDEDPKQYLEESIAQTFQRSPFKEIVEDLGNSEKQDLFHHMVFVLNNLAGLQKKSKIRLDFIGADKEELAGDAARAFGGFFERDWRVYDYRIGRETAYAKLTEILGQSYPKEQSASGSGEHEDYVIKQEWRDKFPKVTAKDFNPDHLKELQTRILERADGVMKDLDVPGLFRWAVKRFVLKKHLKKFITNSE
jgi:hypothetical protein